MSKLKKSLIAVLSIVGLLAMSGIAAAQHVESHDGDTLFSFGYDEANHVLAVNLGPNDTSYICQYQNGTLQAVYGEAGADDGVIPINDILDGDTTKEFAPRPQEELADDLVAATEPAPYGGEDGVCLLNGIEVAGPNGQINHGQFMKAFKSLIEMKGHGCITRYLAQSDLGRTDATKIRTSDVVDHVVGEMGDLTFFTYEADCIHGKKARDGDATLASNGKPGSPGKSSDAPGKAKAAQAHGKKK